jgi:hypothetical protein
MYISLTDPSMMAKMALFLERKKTFTLIEKIAFRLDSKQIAIARKDSILSVRNDGI